ncbi:MAG: type II secretion system protein [Candidatus Paceibacterota bacterium]|jgi:type II secretory pathway pseudopilin PulG
MKSTIFPLRDARAFSLIELLLYVGILGIVGGLLTGILTTATKTQVQQTSQDKLSGELSFAMQTIQRLVQSSSLIEMDAGTASTSLKLRTQNLAQDPTLVYLSGGTAYIQQGSSTPQALTDSAVLVSSLQFQKFSQYPGKDVVQIDIAMSDANQPTALARSLRSAVSRASAATFDSDLIPGADNSYSVGVGGGNRWKNAQFSGTVSIANQLGIGTLAPSYPLDLEVLTNGIFVSSTATTSSYFLMNLQAGTTTALYVRNDGNIGIGTTTPAYGVDIYDTFHITGTSTFDGDIVFGGSTSTPIYHISNVATPATSTDAATKGYVDANAGGGIVQVSVYTNPGPSVWAKPAGATHVMVEVVGGGGGGGGGGNGITGGGGGGSGGYCREYIDVSSITSAAVTIGSGGNGGNGSVNGSSGGASSFGSYCGANGGSGGYYGYTSIRPGATGASISTLTGDVTVGGNPGMAGGQSSMGGNGGASVLGGVGLGCVYYTTLCPGVTYYDSGWAGSVGGGGGGASYNGNYSHSGVGGKGGDGIVIVTSYK